MDFAIVKVPAAAVRKKARHQSEMVNQLLFGESVKVTREKGNLWAKVCSLHDDYQGWMTNTLLEEVTEKEARAYSDHITMNLVNPLLFNNTNMQVPFAASLPQFIEGEGRIGKLDFEFRGKYEIRKRELSETMVKQLTSSWLNAPYLWGGRTILGVDCSGFAQVIFKAMGFDLSRDAWQQAQQGRPVKKLKDAVCGDLAFFDDKEEIVHVGILLNSEQIIHASGKVRIDTIDKKGIINSDTGKRTHSLRAIRHLG